jgi:hypothetical protein
MIPNPKAFAQEPRKLFLLDGIGAIISALFLGVVLYQFETFFGMPRPALVPLAGAAVGFAIFSLTCAAVQPKNWRIFVRLIASFNFIYAVVTFVILIRGNHPLTPFGVVYFVNELIVLALIITLELKTAAIPQTENPTR